MGKCAAVALIAGLLTAGSAHAQPSVPGSGVTATAPWSRATPGGADTAAVYVTLKSPVQDRLIGASSPQAAKAEIHQITVSGNVMVMRELQGGLSLPPGQPVPLQPGGYHIMLTGLKGPLTLNQTFPLHLVFQVSQPIDVVARVAAVGVSTHRRLPATTCADRFTPGSLGAPWPGAPTTTYTEARVR